MERSVDENNVRNDVIDEDENTRLYPFGVPVSLCSTPVQMGNNKLPYVFIIVQLKFMFPEFNENKFRLVQLWVLLCFHSGIVTTTHCGEPIVGQLQLYLGFYWLCLTL
ncbi:3552_t:CDS:1 [Acaulospora morrowiae]|uniref:3552_t:CDS:1 n=1 Tax=Acaulospora morrowiae TaxID=94023 RepID=A0A9N9CUT8_9GLOM|nr:3552_t:CDS:1 [Acaulospora morrowiae]